MIEFSKNSPSQIKPLINFVHGNGFPAGSYQTFLNYFTEDYEIIAQEKYGHNPNFPIHNNWQYLVDELIVYIKQQDQPVICIGHSFGGVISFIAACQQPSLFKGLIMLDPPAMTGVMSWLLKLFKNTAYLDKITPAGKAKKRRSHWPADTDLNKLFRQRPLFKNFDERCLKDYTRSAMEISNNRLELTFDAHTETEIFRNTPTHLSSFKNQLKIPAALIYGESSDLYPELFFKRFAKKNKKISLYSIAGGHMFPLEHPKETAILIKQIIDQWD
ncbi:MAG: pimeloyl-ACP methyl ester carboxylesterase [Alteromonadaceae bacterium]|jgi:pimeloyl-ACP methyl ester carboxylesterase|tara:strand:- start:3387 stop:4205 length:819 start_codon:yes stop_codon:yes gene_type:complete